MEVSVALVVAVIGYPVLAFPAETLLAVLAEQILLRLRGRLSDMLQRHEERIGVSKAIVPHQEQNACWKEVAVTQLLRLLTKSAAAEISGHQGILLSFGPVTQ